LTGCDISCCVCGGVGGVAVGGAASGGAGGVARGGGAASGGVGEVAVGGAVSGAASFVDSRAFPQILQKRAPLTFSFPQLEQNIILLQSVW